MTIKLRALDVASRASGYVNAWVEDLSRTVDKWDCVLGSAYERERARVTRVPEKSSR